MIKNAWKKFKAFWTTDYKDDFFENQCLPRAFSIWAFGEQHKLLTERGKISSWNDLHGDKYKVNYHDDLKNAVATMQKMWVDQVNEANKAAN